MRNARAVPGLIRPPLEERGISIEYAGLYRPGAPLPDVTRAAARDPLFARLAA
jgi:hypothetical protein